ncbi:hypothetical protein [Spiroplasma monobiae]|uniref:Uncharacterized protein n=1 Tax=Spiroplasma monobiae MQ-1 TaxID=1336748 RepID=A0A2K9LWH9_SPISQ|nr:hypothetical protein [Spiroplasma monobiae]AUM62755.1 hypothetical protein SMONO_v1c05060 [Spiroplasma monobiae MQ-1]
MNKRRSTSKKFLKLVKIEKEKLLIFKNQNVWFSDNALIHSICIFKLDYFMQIADKELKTLFSSRFFILLGYETDENKITDMILRVKLMREVIKSTMGLNKNTLIMLYPIQDYINISFDFIFLAYGKEDYINIISLSIIDKEDDDIYWHEVMPKNGSKHVLDYFKPLGERLSQYIAENHIIDTIKISNILFLPFVHYNPQAYLFHPKFADMYEIIEQTSISAMVLASNMDPLLNALESSFKSIDVQRTDDWIDLYYVQDDDYYKKNKDFLLPLNK